MNRPLISATIVIVLIWVSCSKIEDIISTFYANDAIEFNTTFAFSQSPDTDAALYADTTSINSLGVIGYYTASKSWADVGDGTSPNIMYNQEVTYTTDRGWEYPSVQYWSGTIGDMYTFFTYAPYSGSAPLESGISVKGGEETKGVPTLSFEVNAVAEDMVDFIAGQVVDQQQISPIYFNLKRQLTRVRFTARSSTTSDEALGTSATTIVITGLELVNSEHLYKSGEYTFGDITTDTLPNEHAQDGVWRNLVAWGANYDASALLNTEDVEIGGYKQRGVSVANGNSVAVPLFESGDYLLLLPPNGQEGITQDIVVQVAVTYQIVTADPSMYTGYTASDYSRSTLSLPESSLKQGRDYDIEFVIDLEAVNAEAVVVSMDEDDKR